MINMLHALMAYRGAKVMGHRMYEAIMRKIVILAKAKTLICSIAIVPKVPIPAEHFRAMMPLVTTMLPKLMNVL